MKRPVIIIIALVTIMAGCKIDTAGLPGASTSNAGLLIGKWYLKSEGVSGTAFGVPTSYTETDFTSQDFYIYNKDQSLTISEVTAGNGVGVGSYSYDAANLKLTLTDPNGTSLTADVKKLTADSLVYSMTVSIPALTTQETVTNHLAHK